MNRASRWDGCNLCKTHLRVPPGGGPNPHAHPKTQESFYVLEGEIQVKNESQTYTAGKGSFVNIPLGGMVHCFKNKSNEVAKLLCIVVPSGLEDFFLEIGKPINSITFLPPPVIDTAGMERIKTIAEKHGQVLYPPDYLG
ncbi:MAG: cupin domain-containing protein [Bacteroidota bacterium]